MNLGGLNLFPVFLDTIFSREYAGANPFQGRRKLEFIRRQRRGFSLEMRSDRE